MKSGTAQKMLFDMISTTVMIRLGRVEDNSMVNMALMNDKAVCRAVRLFMEKSQMDDYESAKKLVLAHGGVRKALDTLINANKS